MPVNMSVPRYASETSVHAMSTRGRVVAQPKRGKPFGSSQHRTLFHLAGCGHVSITRSFNRNTVADARYEPIRHHRIPVRAQLRRRKPSGCMPFVLVDDDLDRARHLLADFEYVFNRCQFIEFSAKDHQRAAKIRYPRSQVETTNEFIKLGFVLVAGHEHEAIFVSRRSFFEDFAESRFETGKADHHATKPVRNR